MSRPGSPNWSPAEHRLCGGSSLVPCSLCPHRHCPWALAGPVLAGSDSASARGDQVPSAQAHRWVCALESLSHPMGARVPCPFFSGRGTEGSDELSFVTGRVSTTCFQIPCLTESVHPKFRGSASEPDRPQLGQLTHPDGVFGWRLPSDQVPPGTRHTESASIWPRENSTFTAIL